MRKLREYERLPDPLSKSAKLVRRFTGRLAGMVIVIRLLLEEFFQLRTSLGNQGSGKATGRFLALGGQVLDSHVKQGNIFLEPAQGFLHARNAQIVRQHENGSNDRLNLQGCHVGKLTQVLRWVP
jgi:hypothetical protein